MTSFVLNACPSVRQSRNSEIIEPDPVLDIGGTVVTLYADLVVSRRRQLARRRRLKLALGVRTVLGDETVARNYQPKLDHLAGHGFSPRDNHQISIDQLLNKLEYRLTVVIPGYSGLLVLLGRPGIIRHCYVDSKFAAAAIRRRTYQSVLDIMCRSRLVANLQGALTEAPRRRIFPQP